MAENKVLECGLIAKDEKIIKRFESLCERYGYSFQVWEDHERFMEDEIQCRMVAFYCPTEGDSKMTAQAATEVAQGVSFSCETAYRFAIFDKLLNKDDTTFLKKSGIHCIMSKQDAEETSKLEFFCSQMIRAEYVAIKEADLVVDVEVGFDVYHLMPLSGKFLKLIRAGNSFDDRKQAKMKEVGEFYVHRKELPLFTQYAREFGNTDGGIMRICRAQFLEFQSKFGELAMMLTDESETMSFEEGKKLLDDCNGLARGLAASLAKVGVRGMWDVINNSSVGEFGSLDRSPAVAAYAAFFSMAVGVEKLDDVIFGALVMDLGMIYLEPKTSIKISENRMEDFDEEEKEMYHKFPQKSVDVILRQRLPLDEDFKKTVMMSREQANGEGFPKGLPADKLTRESQILGFSAFFDQATLLTMGRARSKPSETLNEIISEQILSGERFSAMLLVEIKKAFGQKAAAKPAA